MSLFILSVAVLCKNQFYHFPALWPTSGHAAVDEEDIYDILRAIELNASQALPEETTRNAIGVLTSTSRSDWADARMELLQSSPKNAAALHIIDSALFVLVLDDFVPPNMHAAGSNMLHGTSQLNSQNNLQLGTCLNRWYDKLQLIVCKDGTSGINFEHSTIDGHTALRFVSDMYSETVITFAESIIDLIHGRGRIQHIVEATLQRAAIEKNDSLDIHPKKILFEISDKIQERIYYAETNLCDNVVSTDTFVLEFTGFGMALMKKNNFSPDSFVQMSIMLAYYKLYGKLVCTYEPVLTKVSENNV
jgi:carnitine O-acetyltransferase